LGGRLLALAANGVAMGRGKNPTVSVIVPTYNRAHLLGRAIKSVLDQTYQDFELIIVDDASTDNTKEVVKCLDDPRIRYVRHEENRGGAAARNTGIKTARGQFIAFQDSDDRWLPDKLEKQMRVFKSASPKVGVVYTGFWRLRDGERTYIPSSKVTRREGDIHDVLLEKNFVTTHVVVRKECFGKAGMFDERLPRLQDWDLWIRISRYYHFLYVGEPLVEVYYTPDSISSDDKALIMAEKLILERYSNDIERNKKSLAKHLYVIGNLLCQNGEMDQGRDYLLEAARLYPLSIKYLIAATLSLFGERVYSKVVKLKRKIQPLPEP